jgi:hypothetical protein
MVRIEKNYRFEGPGGLLSLQALFEGRRQLVVYHFMFDPAWEKGCPSCTSYANSIGDLAMLHKCDTNFVMVSRAPLSKLETYNERQGWRLPWVFSFGSDFNYDFHVTNDETIAPTEYNYRNKAELEANKVPNVISGEEHGLSVFFRMPRPLTRSNCRTLAFDGCCGSCCSCYRRASSICLICSSIKRRSAISRLSSASVLDGTGHQSGVRSPTSCSGALRSFGLKPRMPRRTNAAFIRLTMPVRLPTSCSRSQVGRFASSPSRVGIAAMLQCFFLPRNQQRSNRISGSARRNAATGGNLFVWSRS